jgi:hypothetical protein
MGRAMGEHVEVGPSRVQLFLTRTLLEAILEVLQPYQAKRWALEKPMEQLRAFMHELHKAEVAQVGHRPPHPLRCCCCCRSACAAAAAAAASGPREPDAPPALTPASLPLPAPQHYTELLPQLADVSDLWMHEYQAELFAAQAREAARAGQRQAGGAARDVPMELLQAISRQQPPEHFVQAHTLLVPLHVYNDARARVLRLVEVHHLERDVRDAASECVATVVRLLAGRLFRHAKLLGANQVGPWRRVGSWPGAWVPGLLAAALHQGSVPAGAEELRPLEPSCALTALRTGAAAPRRWPR